METTNLTNVWVINDKITDFVMVIKNKLKAKRIYVKRIKLHKDSGWKILIPIKTNESYEIVLVNKKTNKIKSIELTKEKIY